MKNNPQRFRHTKWASIGFGFLTAMMTMQAAPVSVSDAQNVALNWMKEHTGKTFHIKTSLGTQAQDTATLPTYRIIRLDPQGWVIVSGDDVARPVIGYGESPINPVALPPAFTSWMHGVDQLIASAVMKVHNQKLGVGGTKEFSASWQHFKQPPEVFSANRPSKDFAATAVVNPLLWKGGNTENSGILWGQGALNVEYNEKTPVDGNGPNGRALTGCVATAMGQVMLYYKKPVTGTGSHGYTISTPKYQHNYGYQFADFAVTYDWANMPDKLTATSTPAQVEAVSTLLYHAGVSVEMDYGTGTGDGGSLSAYHDPAGGAAADMALHDYFGFTVKWHSRDDEYQNDDAGWKQLLNTSLDNSNPVLFGGIGTGGHAFVLDGYGDNEAYHINWGFDGVANGWYFIDYLAPVGTGYNFSQYQQVIIFNEVGGGNNNNNNNNNNGTGTGGGCTYNPRNNGIDLMLLLMVMLAGWYPVRRKYFQQA